MIKAPPPRQFNCFSQKFGGKILYAGGSRKSKEEVLSKRL